VLVSLLYLLFRRSLAVAALRLRSREFKELEIVVLRHELATLRRQVARVGCQNPRPACKSVTFRILVPQRRPAAVRMSPKNARPPSTGMSRRRYQSRKRKLGGRSIGSSAKSNHAGTVSCPTGQPH
jgi:hypothetical protein